MLSRFHTIPACHGQTDGQTDRITISISRVSSSMLTRDKNPKNFPCLQLILSAICLRADLRRVLNVFNNNNITDLDHFMPRP